MVGLRQQSNFSQLKAHDEQLERLGLLAERYFADDPNTCLLKLRQLTEGIALARLDKKFNGQPQHVLESFNDALWAPQPQSAQP